MINNKLILKSIFIILTISMAVTSGFSGEMETWEKLLAENNKEYPGCVFLVQEEAQDTAEEQRNELVPILLNICINGRQIGEKRMQKMYDIDPKKTKPKKESFMIKIVPLDEDIWFGE